MPRKDFTIRRKVVPFGLKLTVTKRYKSGNVDVRFDGAFRPKGRTRFWFRKNVRVSLERCDCCRSEMIVMPTSDLNYEIAINTYQRKNKLQSVQPEYLDVLQSVVDAVHGSKDCHGVRLATGVTLGYFYDLWLDGLTPYITAGCQTHTIKQWRRGAYKNHVDESRWDVVEEFFDAMDKVVEEYRNRDRKLG